MKPESYFIARSIPEPNSGCWLWELQLNKQGYGRMRDGGRKLLAHRAAYATFVCDIPEGLVLDHKCRVHMCINPEHLEPVTHRENILRGEGAAARLSKQTHCKHGHEFTPENTSYIFGRWRQCKKCSLDRLKKWVAGKRSSR